MTPNRSTLPVLPPVDAVAAAAAVPSPEDSVSSAEPLFPAIVAGAGGGAEALARISRTSVQP